MENKQLLALVKKKGIYEKWTAKYIDKIFSEEGVEKMTNFDIIKNKTTRKFRDLIAKIEKAATYDDMEDIYYRFQCDNYSIADLINTNICHFCDQLERDCDQKCSKNCKWLDDIAYVSQDNIAYISPFIANDKNETIKKLLKKLYERKK